MELVQSPVAELKALLAQSFELWASENTEKIGGHGGHGASCALSGGATGLIFLPALRAAKVDWSKITLFWADERAVDPDDPESNYGLADRMLLTPLGRKGPRAFRMAFDAPSLFEAARSYDAVLARELSGRPLDLAILGAGDDGHVCSLFPGHDALLEDHSRVVAVDDAPKHPKRRLSLTMRYLLQTRHIWIVAVGARKQPVLQAALSKTQNATPLDLLLHQQGKRVTVFTDQVFRSASTSRRG
jgi:6-phosphogluconolactonase